MARCVLFVLGALAASCGLPRQVDALADDAAPRVRDANSEARAFDCLQSSGVSSLTVTVHHMTGYYPTNHYWTIERDRGRISFSRDFKPEALTASDAARITSYVITVLEDESPDVGLYRTVRAHVRWRCGDGAERQRHFSEVEGDDQGTRIARLERAFQ